MHLGEPLDTVEYGGSKYRAEDSAEPTCDGCAGQHDWSLCHGLPECSGRTFNIVWKEVA